MFEQATLSCGPATKRVWTTCLGISGQVIVVTGMILTPMIWPDVLPKVQTFLPLVPPPRALPPGPSIRPRNATVTPRPAWEFRGLVLRMPVSIPSRVAILEDPEDLAASAIPGMPRGNGGGEPDGVPGGIFTSSGITAPPPRSVEHIAETPKPAGPTTTITRLQVSRLDSARLRHRVEPVYPPMAIQTHISGTVELRGVIGVDGRIRELKVLRGHPFLVKAALDAVSQWIYEPTRLNGETVEVDAPILVTFHLH